MQYSRTIENKLLNAYGQWKAIIIYGARQVGKTTLCKKLWWNQKETLFVTWDDFFTVEFLSNISLPQLQLWVKNYKTVIIDEAQKIKNIGNTIKLMVDNIPEVQVIATWSSSFDLANHIVEPLTWRTKTFYLHPLSIEEIFENVPMHYHKQYLNSILNYGCYPSIVNNNNIDDLLELVQAYTYKDIFLYESLKKPDLIVKLLQALALQIWSEVSYRELWNLLSVDVKTIQRYIALLEQAFIIFRLSSFSRNLRNELKMGQKIYFRDVGIRNGLIHNIQDITMRSDIWHLRENFIIAERLIFLLNHGILYNPFFWRTITGSEIDFLETDFWAHLNTYEIKRSEKKNPSLPQAFKEWYENCTYQVINPNNFYEILQRK